MSNFILSFFLALFKIKAYFIFKRKKVVYSRSIKLKGCPSVCGSGILVLEDNVKINSGKLFNPIGGDTRTCFTLRGGKIIIGSNSGLSNCTLVSDKLIKIGSNVNIGGSVKIYDTDFHSISPQERFLEKPGEYYGKSVEVILGDNVFIGAHSIILKGVTIGDNSIVGAGSVVTKSIPKNQIWAGNPAKYIKDL
ncbi:hypothetical protein MOW08_00440 [Acinetobacter schindleri]|nr:hypothetical protein MOW08_00440 [Acinetobacter schindleri]